MIETRNSTLPERLGNGRSRQTFYGYPVLFREDGGEWQENNPQWVDGKLTGVPYKLAVDTEKMSLTMTDMDGSVSSIALKDLGITSKKKAPVYKGKDIIWADYAPDMDVVIHADTHFVSFRRVLKTPQASKSATFDVRGTIPVAYRAVDKNGDDVEVAVAKSGDLVTESFEAIDNQYPITIDPTFTSQAASKDTHLYLSQPDTNYGADTSFLITDSQNYTRRTILEFDISSIPANSTLTAATLSLKYGGYGSSDPVGKAIWVYKLSRTDWVEAEATWNSYKTGSAWTSAGGDYVTSDPSGTHSHVPATNGDVLDFDVLTIAASAYAASANVEMLAKFETEGLSSGGSDSWWRSAEYSTAEFRPKLVIEYVAFFQNVGGATITATGALARKILITIGGTVTPTGTLNRLTKIVTGAGTITPTGALGAIKRFIKGVGAGIVTPVGVLQSIKRFIQSVGGGGGAGDNITVGLLPADGGWAHPVYSADYTRTVFEHTNYADGSGILNVIKVWLEVAEAGNSVRVGTFYQVGTEKYCRDAVVLGECSVGYNEFTDINLLVEEGDSIGIDADSAYVSLSGGDQYAGHYSRVNGRYCESGLHYDNTYAWQGNYPMYLQGTGLTSGGILPVGTLARKVSLSIGSGTITPAGVLGLKILLAIGNGIITPAATLGRNIARAVGNATITAVGVLDAFCVGRTLITVGQGTITAVGTLGRKILITIGGTVTPTGALSSIYCQLKSVGQGTITATATLGRKIMIAVGGATLIPVGVLVANKFKVIFTTLIRLAIGKSLTRNVIAISLSQHSRSITLIEGGTMEHLTVKKGDFGYDLTFTLLDSDGETPFNLTGYSGKLNISSNGFSTNDILEGTMSLVVAANGTIKYPVVATNFDVVGEYVGQVEVTKAGANLSWGPFRFSVVPSA